MQHSARHLTLLLLLAAGTLPAQDLVPGREPDDSVDNGEDYSVPLGGPSRSHANLPSLDFAEADRNGDGLLDLEEARATLPADLPLIDENEDGVLSYLELQNALPHLHLDPAMGKVVTEEVSGIGEAEYQELIDALRDYNNKEQADVVEKEESAALPAAAGDPEA